MSRGPPPPTFFPYTTSSDLGLSGGVDSAVAAALVHRAIGDRLTCIFVDHGLLRLNEREQVERTFRAHVGIDLRVVHARSEEHTSELQSHSDLVCRLLLEKKI